MADVENAESLYWQEDADRVNRMAELARQNGMVIKVSPKPKPPQKKVQKPTK